MTTTPPNISAINEAVDIRKKKIAALEQEIEHLLATRQILIGGHEESQKTKKREPRRRKQPEAVPADQEAKPPWTAVALELLQEMPTPFKLDDMDAAIRARGYEVRRPTVSAWLSRAYRERGLIQQAGKKGLWAVVQKEEKKSE